jgi:hypothetical protein
LDLHLRRREFVTPRYCAAPTDAAADIQPERVSVRVEALGLHAPSRTDVDTALPAHIDHRAWIPKHSARRGVDWPPDPRGTPGCTSTTNRRLCNRGYTLPGHGRSVRVDNGLGWVKPRVDIHSRIMPNHVRQGIDHRKGNIGIVDRRSRLLVLSRLDRLTCASRGSSRNQSPKTAIPTTSDRMLPISIPRSSTLTAGRWLAK